MGGLRFPQSLQSFVRFRRNPFFYDEDVICDEPGLLLTFVSNLGKFVYAGVFHHAHSIHRKLSEQGGDDSRRVSRFLRGFDRDFRQVVSPLEQISSLKPCDGIVSVL